MDKSQNGAALTGTSSTSGSVFSEFTSGEIAFDRGIRMADNPHGLDSAENNLWARGWKYAASKSR